MVRAVAGLRLGSATNMVRAVVGTLLQETINQLMPMKGVAYSYGCASQEEENGNTKEVTTEEEKNGYGRLKTYQAACTLLYLSYVLTIDRLDFGGPIGSGTRAFPLVVVFFRDRGLVRGPSFAA